MRNRMRMGGCFSDLPVDLMCPKCNIVYSRFRKSKVFLQDFIKYTCRCGIEWGFSISKEESPFWKITCN